MPILVGTSGWQYRHWRERFYPRGVAQTRWFEWYAERFDTVELNVTFYRQPSNETFEGWARRAPEGFLFAAKTSRFLTHIRRLQEPDQSVQRFLDGACRLGRHLGPVLVQLPPDLEAEPGRLDDTLSLFPSDVRVAFEPRHRSWFRDDVRKVLERHGAALCWADRRGWLNPPWRTASWGYVRFHGGRAAPRPCYGDRALESAVELVADTWRENEDVFVYFNNDHRACALANAATFARIAERRGRVVSRTPDPRSIAVG
ncbi:MAG TPA: DUF72 domain-containing protein [Candidatus Limnocylindrales bacterium]|nr:DUF72 domain-containing protein [Candidatus Limnocylindrales bacterium]